MIALLLVYFIGKNFYELAHEHNRSPWGYATLSIVVFYALQFIIGFGIGIFMVITEVDIESISQFVLGLIVVILSGLAIVGFHKILKKIWQKKGVLISNTESELLDDKF